MTAHDSPHVVTHRMQQVEAFMRQYGKETALLGTLMHHRPDRDPHDPLPNYESAAREHGLNLVYMGAEVSTYDSDEPLYYVFLSTHDQFTLEEAKALIPDFVPIHSYEFARSKSKLA